MTLSRVTQQGATFVDAGGGQMILRGVNLGGDSKVPYPSGGTQFPSDFADHRDVSFIGRPFPIEEADEHLGRIAHWGFNTLRLLTTWEAVEHRGPGIYDNEYLDYFTEVARRAGQHGLYLFVDFHQDVWSRMSGGDGAPGWTFEAVGLDFTRFDAADAACVMQARYDYNSPEGRQAAYPQMVWGSNYRLPANGIMWTLFWGGRMFTPDFAIDGENVQDFLQGHYLGAMEQVAQRLADMPHVLGFDTLNEPGLGWLAQPLSYRHVAASDANPERPRIGPALAPLDALSMARGLTVTVPLLTRDAAGAAVVTGERTFNANKVSIWRNDVQCPFEDAGIYRVEDKSVLPLDEGRFSTVGDDPFSISDHAFAPFYKRVAERVRRYQPDWSIFAEMDAFAHPAGRHFPKNLPDRTVNASHWYDLGMLYLKRFDPAHHRDALSGGDEHGADQISARYRRQLGEIKAAGDAFANGAPTLIGEFGIPYDLDEGTEYDRWRNGDREGLWGQHELALDLMYDAIDALGLHSTQWNYTASNRNDLRIGDGWNQEDLSIFSRDQQNDSSDPDSGGRAVPGFCRPFVRRVQGRLGEVRFTKESGLFRAEFEANPDVQGETQVYVPRIQYPDGFVVRLEDVPAELKMSSTDQIVTVRALAFGPASLTIEPVKR